MRHRTELYDRPTYLGGTSRYHSKRSLPGTAPDVLLVKVIVQGESAAAGPLFFPTRWAEVHGVVSAEPS